MIDGSLVLIYFHDGILDPPYNPDTYCLDLTVSKIVAVDLNAHKTHESEAVLTLTASFDGNMARIVEWECFER